MINEFDFHSQKTIFLQQCDHPLVIYSLSEQIIQDRVSSCMKWMQQETYSDILIKMMTELGQESLKPESDRKQGSQMKTLWQLFTLVLSHGMYLGIQFEAFCICGYFCLPGSE